MRIDSELKLGFKDVMIRPKRSTLKSRSEVDMVREFSFRNSHIKWHGVPVVAANMDKTGTFSMARKLATHKMLTCIHKHYSIDQWKQFISGATPDVLNYVMFSTGIAGGDFDKLKKLVTEIPAISFICVDVANGYSEHFAAFVEKLREAFPSKILVAGNVATGEMVEQLILSGADIVKVGIGPGSVCTTRVKTGVGYPQLSAIIECADAAHGLNGHIIGDGGCACVGDIAKAFGAGSDFVMLGGMLAGHDESETDIVEENGEKFCLFYGMSSSEAMDKYAGGVAEYRASEGKTTLVPYRGPVESTVREILGGVRSACTYVGAQKLKELSKRTTFVRVSEQENRVYS